MVDLDDLRFFESDKGDFLVVETGNLLDSDGRYAFVDQSHGLSVCDCALSQDGTIDIFGKTYVRGEVIPNLMGKVVRGSVDVSVDVSVNVSVEVPS